MKKEYFAISPAAYNRFDGVGDYSFFLARALQVPGCLTCLESGARENIRETDGVELHYIKRLGSLEKSEHQNCAENSRYLMIHWIPQRYILEKDFIKWLFWISDLRKKGVKIVWIAHEYSLPASFSVRRLIARLLFDISARVMGKLASAIVLTNGHAYRRFQLKFYHEQHKIFCVPVGSNIPRVEGAPLFRQPGKLIFTILGQPAAMDRRISEALMTWVAGRHSKITLRWIGRSADEISNYIKAFREIPPNVEIHGGKPPLEVSGLLQSTDLFLAPIVDGVSSRRTSVTTAFEHGLPVVGTDGACTDQLFRGQQFMKLSPGGSVTGFVRNLEEMVKKLPEENGEWRKQSRAFFELIFSWEKIAQSYHHIFKSMEKDH